MDLTKRILLVDDDSDDQEFFMDALVGIKNVSLLGVVSNGREALARLREFAVLPDFIFMDFQMPLMNGLECLREIGKDPHMSHIPVIMLSGSNERRQEALDHGAAEFIKKPGSDKLMNEELRRVLAF